MLTKRQLAKRTGCAILNWSIREDVRSLYHCLFDRNYRPVMTGEWVSHQHLHNVLQSLDDPVYTEWCIQQNILLEEKALNAPALYETLGRYREHILQHGGLCAEFGVFQGHSLRESAAMLPEHHWYGFDSFEGFEEDWQINNGQYALHKDAFSVNGRLPTIDTNNVTLVKGYFSQSLPQFIATLESNTHFSLIHIDCDTYDAVNCVFTHLDERLVAGTIIVLDDLVGIIGISDAMKALYEFLGTHPFEWLLCGRGPNQYTVLDRGCVMTHWLFANKVGMFSAALRLL